MIEVEIKTRISDKALNLSGEECRQVSKKIEELGFGQCVHQKMVDTYYDSRDDCLSARGTSLRVREYKYGDTGNWLCFKGQKITGKTREENDVQVGDGIHRILENLGYRVIAKVSKNRWKYTDNGIDVCLDSVDGLGTFVEIESMAPEESIRGELDIITDLMHRLGYTELVDESYLELTLGK